MQFYDRKKSQKDKHQDRQKPLISYRIIPATGRHDIGDQTNKHDQNIIDLKDHVSGISVLDPKKSIIVFLKDDPIRDPTGKKHKK